MPSTRIGYVFIEPPMVDRRHWLHQTRGPLPHLLAFLHHDQTDLLGAIWDTRDSGWITAVADVEEFESPDSFPHHGILNSRYWYHFEGLAVSDDRRVILPNNEWMKLHTILRAAGDLYVRVPRAVTRI